MGRSLGNVWKDREIFSEKITPPHQGLKEESVLATQGHMQSVFQAGAGAQGRSQKELNMAAGPRGAERRAEQQQCNR